MARRPPDPVARLLAIPPRRFTAARAEAAKALEDAGDPAAGAVRRLRRPIGLAWAMNRLALDRRDDVDALLAAGDRVRAGQRRAISGGGAETLRAAEAELRERARALRLAGAEVLKEDGRQAPQAALARLELLLRTVAIAPGPARDAFREGRLEREPEIAPGDLSGFAVVAGQDAPAAAAEPAPPGGRGAHGEPSRRTERPGAAARDVHARADAPAAAAGVSREERARGRRETRERERARTAAAAALARARASERKADAAARAAETAATRAVAAAASAADRARALRARADEARAEAERRQAAVAALGPDRP